MHIEIDIHIDIHIHIQANIDDLGWTFAFILICTLTFRLEANAYLRLDIDFGLITWDSEEFGAFLGVV